MAALTLDQAETIVRAARAAGAEKKLKPLAIVVLDARGVVRAAIGQDGISLMRFDVAFGKAYGALGAGVGSRALDKMARERPHFMEAFVAASGGRCVPVPGGVLIRDKAGEVLGAVGISGDASDNDETAALAGIAAAGLTGDAGAG
jgi:uncharacterized protein GlcG (DUF336 family)